MASDWEELKSNYNKKGLVLFLGAGVSIQSGVPTWSDLICRMMESLPQTGGKDAFNTLRQAGFSLPTITEFIKRKIDAGLFISALRECLYREFKFRDVERIDDGTAGRFVEDTDKCNPTLVAVYNLAVLDRPDGLTANPKVHAIVNFNLDALLEQYDKARHLVKGLPGKRRCIHTIESPSHDRIFGRVNIYSSAWIPSLRPIQRESNKRSHLHGPIRT